MCALRQQSTGYAHLLLDVTEKQLRNARANNDNKQIQKQLVSQSEEEGRSEEDFKTFEE